ncbi:MAG TPA: type II toxin-antitoxin system RelE/ParE family toxin [Urbifossiella sp.]|nr:type II toxin-antitoxin system RelE/ParE family toxin [Urbifossiella sp.]
MPPIREWMTFIHTDSFDAAWRKLGLDDEDLARLQKELVGEPEIGSVIPGTGGLRKMRFAREGTGKSGSFRVCYASFLDHGVILLVIVYGKQHKSDITPAEKQTMARLLKEFAEQLES